MQDKRKGLAELLEPGNHIPAGWARAESWDPFRQPLPVAAGPALPSSRFICHRAIDGRAGAVVQVMSRSESLVLLCQLTRGEGVDTCVRSLTTQRAPGAANGIASVCAAGTGTKGAAASTDADVEERGQDADGGVGS